MQTNYDSANDIQRQSKHEIRRCPIRLGFVKNEAVYEYSEVDNDVLERRRPVSNYEAVRLREGCVIITAKHRMYITVTAMKFRVRNGRATPFDTSK